MYSSQISILTALAVTLVAAPTHVYGRERAPERSASSQSKYVNAEQEYRAIRAALEEAYPPTESLIDREYWDKQIELSGCFWANPDFDGYRPPYKVDNSSYSWGEDPYLWLADAVRLEGALNRHGVDVARYKTSIAEIEAKMLKWMAEQEILKETGFEGINKAQEHMSYLIQGLLQKLARDYPDRKFKFDPQSCGGGYETFIVVANPKPASIKFMSKWNWIVCKRRDVNPMDVKKCANWRNVAAPSEEAIGDTYYMVEWPNGKILTGQFSFTNRHDGPYKIQIRPNGLSFLRATREDYLNAEGAVP